MSCCKKSQSFQWLRPETARRNCVASDSGSLFLAKGGWKPFIYAHSRSGAPLVTSQSAAIDGGAAESVGGTGLGKGAVVYRTWHAMNVKTAALDASQRQPSLHPFVRLQGIGAGQWFDPTQRITEERATKALFLSG